ncbi:MAG TPA: SH3 domain-containing protein, partial [Myxococcaceae bacterium]|nr:SH3 domain-containing protein [Myxococcaceae bacterium]
MIAALILASVLSQDYYTPQESQAVFQQANQAYDREDYASAKQAYQQLLAHGFEGADILFNLGTTCLAAGDLGEAVLYLERARRAGGSAADIDGNLALARSRQLDQVVGGAEEPFLQRLVAATSSELAAWSFLIAWVGGF